LKGNEFFKETLSLVGPEKLVKGVRMDKGFFDKKNFNCLEDRSIEYICKAPFIFQCQVKNLHLRRVDLAIF